MKITKLLSNINNLLPQMQDLNLVQEHDQWEYQKRKTSMVICLIGGLISSIILLTRLMFEGFVTSTLYWVMAITFVAMCGPIAIKFLGKRYSWYLYLLKTLVVILIVIRAIDSGGTQSGTVMWFFMTPILAGFAMGRIGAVFASVLSVIGIWLVYLLPLYKIVNIGYYSHPMINAVSLIIAIIGIGFVCFYYAKTKEKNLELIHQFEKQFHSAEKFAGIGRMSAGIAYQVNNPLAIISLKMSWFSGKLERWGLHENEKIEFMNPVNHCLASVEKISDIIRTLKDFTSDHKLNPEMLPVKVVLENVRYFFSSRLIDTKVKLNIHCDDDMVMVNKMVADRVFSNLMANSLDAISEWNERWIAITVHPVQAESSELVIDFMDSGNGISAEVAQRMFDPFYTTKTIEKGTGLGLGICRSFLNELGGEITYISESSHTHFQIIFPIDKKI